MKKKLIVGFDGTIRAGKSTIVKNLASLFSGDLINEYKYYADKYGKEFPPFPPKNKNDVINATELFVSLEKKRYSDINKCVSKIIFVDRTFHSCIGFDYATSKFLNIKTFNEAKELWNMDDKKIVPDVIFFMNVSHKKMIHRIAKNNDVFPDHIKDKKFNFYLKKYLKTLLGKNFIEINADKSKEAVRLEVGNHIKSMLKSR